MHEVEWPTDTTRATDNIACIINNNTDWNIKLHPVFILNSIPNGEHLITYTNIIIRTEFISKNLKARVYLGDK